MNTQQFDPERSTAIRAGLATKVEGQRRMPVPGWRALTTVAIAGLLVGGAVTAAVAVNLPRGDKQVRTSEEAPALPDGFIPGAPIISLVEGPTSSSVTTSSDIPLSPPTGANYVRVSVTCLTGGMTMWGFDPGGNNPGSSCVEGERGEAWMDFPLDEDNTLYVRPDPGVEVIVTTQFLARVETEWGINASGQTYGVSKPGRGDPDLIAAIGIDGTEGYVDARELNEVDGTRQTLDEVLADQRAQSTQLNSGGGTVPLYESDGVTVIGEFRVG